MHIFLALAVLIFYFEVRMTGKLDAINTAIDALKQSISDAIARETATLQAALDAANGNDSGLQTEVIGVVGRLTDLKTTVDAIDPAAVTAPPVAAALTLTSAVTAGEASQTVGISDSTGLSAGQSVTVDSGESVETVVLTDVPSSSQIAAVFTLDHAAGVTVAPVVS